MDESVTVAGATNRKGLIALILLLAVLAAVVAVPLALGGDDDELRPLGLVPGGGSSAEMTGAAADAMYPYQRITYELEGDLPDLGDEGPVWQLVRPPMDAARAGELAAALGAPGEVTEREGGYSVVGDDAAADVYPSGGAWLVSVFGSEGSYDDGVREDVEARPPAVDGDGSTCVESIDPDGMSTMSCETEGVGTVIPPDGTYEEPPMEGPEDLPTEQEAIDIAVDLLQGAGVLPAEHVAEVSEGSAMGFTTSCSGGDACIDSESEMIVLSRNVTVTTTLGGLRVEGLSWSVEVGDHGDVQGVWGVYADAEEVGDYPLRPIDAAYAAMVGGELPSYGGPMPLGGVAVDAGVGAPAVMVGGDASVGSGEVTVATSSPCPDSPIADCAVTSDSGPKPEPICSNDGCAVPGGPGDDVVCVTHPCPGGDDPPPPVGCVVQPDGTEICEPPMPVDPPLGCKVQPDGTDICEPIEEPPFEPELPSEPEPVVVTVTGATLGAMAVPAVAEDGSETAYVVPTYVFQGTWDSGEAWSQPVVAVSDEWLGTPVPSTTVPVEPPTTVDGVTTTMVIDPDCIGPDGEDRCVTSSVPTTSVVETPVVTILPFPCVVQPDGSEICEIPSTTVPTTLEPGVAPEQDG